MRSPTQATLISLAGSLLAAVPAGADPAAFDLVGPSLDVQVTRGSTTLPIAQVPNLSAGDRVAIEANFAADYSV